jgi:hypothetical protein
MTVTDQEFAALKEQLRVLTDQAELARLCDSYVIHLDRDRDDDAWLSSVFTEDAWLTFPMGEYKGLDGLLAFQEMSRTNFALSHHTASNYDIDVDGDSAHARVHLTAVHVASSENPLGHFDIGGHYEADAVRTPEGWRFRRLIFDLVWSSGGTPQSAAAGALQH